MHRLPYLILTIISVLVGVWIGRSAMAPKSEAVSPAKITEPNSKQAVRSAQNTTAPIAGSPTLLDALAIADSFERGLAIRQAIAALPKNAFKSTFDSLQIETETDDDFSKNHSRQKNYSLARKLLMERWASTDPESALATIEELLDTLDVDWDSDPYLYTEDRNDTHQMSLISTFFNTWLKSDSKAAWATIIGWKDRANPKGAGFLLFLSRQFPLNDPAWAEATFEQNKADKAPFNYEAFFITLQNKMEKGGAEALRFLTENLDYLPYDAWIPNRGCFGGATTFDLIRESDAAGAFKIWSELEASNFKTSFGNDSIAHALRTGDLALAAKFFDQMSLKFGGMGPVDPFAPPGQYYTGFEPTARLYFSGLARHDTNLALAEAHKLDDVAKQEFAYGTIATILSYTDPERALALCLELPPKASATFIGEIFKARMSQDFEAAKVELTALQPETWPSDQQEKILSIMWQKEPIYAAEFLMQMNAPPALVNNIRNGLNQLINDGKFEEYIRVTEILPPMNHGPYSSFIENIAQEWNAADPQSALSYGINMPLGKSRTEFLGALAENTAKSDYQAAWDLSETTTDPYLKKQLQLAAIEELGESNPEAAIAFAMDHTDNTDAMQMVIRNWIWDDASAALDYIQSMPQSDIRTEALSTYISRKASSTPLREMQRMLQDLPPGEDKDHAIEYVADEWAKSNPMALAEWINEMPNSRSRDGAVSALVESLAAYDYSQAFAWSTTIQDKDTREWKLQHTLESYAEMDPAGAKTLLEEADLSSSEKAKLFEEVFK